MDNPNVYRMTSNPRGFCLILCMTEFMSNLYLNRRGAEIDCKKLQYIFQRLNFVVKTFMNPDSRQVLQIIRQYSNDPDLDNTDSFVFIVLSHRESQQFVCSDGVSVPFERVITRFNNNNCHKLIDRPKLFFFFCSKGRDLDEGVVMADNWRMVRGEEQSPDDYDMMICYSTVPGQQSWRNSQVSGSPFVSDLCEVLTRHSQKELYNILRITSSLVINRKDFIKNNIFDEQEYMEYTFRGFKKHFYFNNVSKNEPIIANGIFDNNFEKVSSGSSDNGVLGIGGFGTVYRVKDSNDNLYAIKEIHIRVESEMEKCFDEFRLMSMLHADYVVDLIDVWIENLANKTFMYIQMELCLDNLSNTVENLRNIFDRKPKEIMSSLEFFILTELFRELTQCLNYLHTLKPKPILHRDLKPENVLITSGRNGRFTKICDFGLARLHGQSSYTRMQGTIKYMAQEVKDGRHYGLKADIYSLGIIVCDLFELKLKDENIASKYLNTGLENNFKVLCELLDWNPAANFGLTQNEPDNRPNCQQVLGQINCLAIDKNVALSEFNSLDDLTKYKITNSYFNEFLKSKLRIDRNVVSEIIN